MSQSPSKYPDARPADAPPPPPDKVDLPPNPPAICGDKWSRNCPASSPQPTAPAVLPPQPAPAKPRHTPKIQEKPKPEMGWQEGRAIGFVSISWNDVLDGFPAQAMDTAEAANTMSIKGIPSLLA